MHKSIVNDGHLVKMYVFFVSLFPFRLIKFFTACCKHKFSHTEDLLGFYQINETVLIDEGNEIIFFITMHEKWFNFKIGDKIYNKFL